MSKVDPRGWWINIVPSVLIIGCAALIVTELHHPWSWPLFVWGAVIGPIAAAWMYFSTMAFGRRLIRHVPADRDVLEERRRALWPKYRATYAGIALLGVAIGILAAGLHSVAVDVVFTVMWFLFGILPPLILRPLLLRKYVAGQGRDGAGT